MTLNSISSRPLIAARLLRRTAVRDIYLSDGAEEISLAMDDGVKLELGS
jgi:hypothetical protein